MEIGAAPGVRSRSWKAYYIRILQNKRALDPFGERPHPVELKRGSTNVDTMRKSVFR
jgi:hypothetical protein